MTVCILRVDPLGVQRWIQFGSRLLMDDLKQTSSECRWFLSHAHGDPHTKGSFNEAQYRYAILPEAQDPNNASACFTLAPWHHI